MPDRPRVMFVSAHAVDFVIRAGGTLARYAKSGSEVTSICLSFGERQESARLWKDKSPLTLDEVKEIRRKEGLECGRLIGSKVIFYDWNDCPLLFDRPRYDQLATDIRKFRPDILITHWHRDQTNWDHHVTAEFALRCVQLAGAGGGIPESGLPIWTPRHIYYCEPWFPFPELCEFSPDTYVDITDVYEQKLAGLRAAWSHGQLETAYGQCSEFRGYQMTRLLGRPVKYAEGFIRRWPSVGIPGLEEDSGRGATQMG
jgi:4-oxalomesaconate hydratase